MLGLTVIDTRTGAYTVSPDDPEMLPRVAVIVVAPAASVVANPPAAIVAMFGALELQFAEEVRSWVLPSLYVPVAVNCCVVPSGIEADGGLTVIETRAGTPTESCAVPTICPSVAEILAVPCPALVASPAVPGLLLTTATAVEDEFHVTVPVRSCVLPSL